MTRGPTSPEVAHGRLVAVIFDVDGTLVDSEQWGHRVAFNDAFAAFGLTDRWDPDTYLDLLKVTGGEARLLSWFARPDSCVHFEPEPEQRRLAQLLHRDKTARFEQMAVAGAVPARKGVTTLLDELDAAGIEMAIATTGSRSWVYPLLDTLFGLSRFSVVVTGDDVGRRKPDPEAYLLALAKRNLDPGAAVAIEDSGNGVRAAVAANLACVVVANAETDLDAVQAAELVVSSFGPEEEYPMTVLRDPHRVARGHRLSVPLLEAVWQARWRPLRSMR